MDADPPSAHPPIAHPPSTARLTVEVDLTGDPITGRLTDQAGTTRAFTGWLDLTSAIDNARAAALAEAGTSAGGPK